MKKLLIPFTFIMFVLFIVYMMLIKNEFLLFKIQELDIFMLDSFYFKETAEKCGGLLVYMASFLNQFFYIPWLGTILFTSLLLLLCWLIIKTFNLKTSSYTLALVPSLFILLTLTQSGYMIYVSKIDALAYVNLLGSIIAVGGVFLSRYFKNKVFRLIYPLLYVGVFYPVAGFWAVLGSVLLIVKHLRKKRFIPALLTGISIAIIPFLYYYFIYETLYLSDIYTTLLPDYSLKGHEAILWLPYLITMVLLVMLAAKLSFKKVYIPAAVLIVAAVVVVKLSYSDDNFKNEILMQRYAENQEWEKILEISAKQVEEPTRLIVMYTDLALFNNGMAGDKMFNYRNGNKAMNSPRKMQPIQMAGAFFFNQYGMMNYSYKWSMEGMVEYGLNPYVLKHFVVSSIFNGERKLAQKYNNLLSGTLFYRKWAEEHQKFIDSEDAFKNDARFKKRLSLFSYSNLLDGDHGRMEDFIRYFFATIVGGNADITELSVLSNLQLKKIESFWPRLFYWASNTKNIPVHFQEAALLFEHLEHKYNMADAPFSKEIRSNFALFLNYIDKYGNYPQEEAKQIFFNAFGKTYWYYYFFENNSVEDKNNKLTPYSS